MSHSVVSRMIAFHDMLDSEDSWPFLSLFVSGFRLCYYKQQQQHGVTPVKKWRRDNYVPKTPTKPPWLLVLAFVWLGTSVR